jgi:hypothetical protein
MAEPDKSVSLKDGGTPEIFYFESPLSPKLEAAEWTWVQAPGVVCTMRPSRWELTKRWIVELIRPAKKRERQRKEREMIDLLERRIEALEANEHQG